MKFKAGAKFGNFFLRKSKFAKFNKSFREMRRRRGRTNGKMNE